jgi:hypothetical protein
MGNLEDRPIIIPAPPFASHYHPFGTDWRNHVLTVTAVIANNISFNDIRQHSIRIDVLLPLAFGEYSSQLSLKAVAEVLERCVVIK